MIEYINKEDLLAEIDNLIDESKHRDEYDCAYRDGNNGALYALKGKVNSLEVIDPYKYCVQYDSIDSGIKCHAEEYSFNIESELFNQLTEEQQKLWRKEIEHACISGGNVGVELARDPRYKENLEVKEVDLEKEISRFTVSKELYETDSPIKTIAKHFFELGLRAKKGK